MHVQCPPCEAHNLNSAHAALCPAVELVHITYTNTSSYFPPPLTNQGDGGLFPP